MIIEIGTSDFDTLAGIEEGIFIEPIKYYYDKLPNSCTKENIAISNYNGETTVFYVSYKDIAKHGLPDWIRGCNSITKPHPTVVRTLLDYGLPINLIQEEKIPVKKLAYIINKYAVKNLDILKIDTEGHDPIIILDYFSSATVLPNKIVFENNILSDQSKIIEAIDLLISLGYNMTHEENNSIGILS